MFLNIGLWIREMDINDALVECILSRIVSLSCAILFLSDLKTPFYFDVNLVVFELYICCRQGRESWYINTSFVILTMMG